MTYKALLLALGTKVRSSIRRNIPRMTEEQCRARVEAHDGALLTEFMKLQSRHWRGTPCSRHTAHARRGKHLQVSA